MKKDVPADPRDVSFAVPFVHRLRFTEDLAGPDFGELLALLEPSASAPPRVLLWADEEVAEASNRVTAIGNQLRESRRIELADEPRRIAGGETVKNSRAIVDAMLEQIHDAGLDRRSYIVVIGGGAVLDAAGYAAAIAHRGIRLVRVPTTTLAQADSGVGVKNAINAFGKKNWVGTFAVPWGVINDFGFLTTLPDREFACGFSEAVKVSLIQDADEFRYLCDHAGSIAKRDPAITRRVIRQSCLTHLRHITRGGDPFEMLEARPLDFGHWSAHRMETLSGYTLRHGEAVSIGVALDCLYSSLVHGMPRIEARRVCECLSGLGLPLWDDTLAEPDKVLAGLEEFRQHLGGRLTITMLRGVGDAIDVHEIEAGLMIQAIRQLHAIAIEMDRHTDVRPTHLC